MERTLGNFRYTKLTILSPYSLENTNESQTFTNKKVGNIPNKNKGRILNKILKLSTIPSCTLKQIVLFFHSMVFFLFLTYKLYSHKNKTENNKRFL